MTGIYGPHGPSMELGNGFEEPHDYEIPRGVNEGPCVGFVQYPPGVVGRCTDCMYYDAGICKNSDSRIYDRPVTSTQCCNYFNAPGMKVIV